MRKNRHVLLALILAAAMTFSIAGCGTKPTDEVDTEVSSVSALEEFSATVEAETFEDSSAEEETSAVSEDEKDTSAKDDGKDAKKTENTTEESGTDKTSASSAVNSSSSTTTGSSSSVSSSASTSSVAGSASSGTESSSTSSNQSSTQKTEESATHTCTISISCSTILNNMDKLDESKAGCVPSSGVIMSGRSATFTDGETVMDVLKRECRNSGIQMETSGGYVEGIGNLYEFDCGQDSGWMYSVNGSYPNVGASSYTLKDGDTIKWVYTCALGNDV